jgi:hypothetical protein
MTGPIKFDFSSYAAAIPATPAIQGQENGSRIAKSHESQSPKAKNAELPGETTSPTNRRIAEIAKDYDDFQDDRHHCRECRNLRNSYCTRQRFRLVDDMPRRCEDFSGYPDWIGQSASSTAAPVADPLLVTVYTPSGTPMTIRADSLEHAAWLKRMNPKPTNPAPEPDLRVIESEDRTHD